MISTELADNTPVKNRSCSSAQRHARPDQRGLFLIATLGLRGYAFAMVQSYFYRNLQLWNLAYMIVTGQCVRLLKSTSAETHNKTFPHEAQGCSGGIY